MEEQWLINLLNSAKEEIKRLRNEKNLMAARLEMFDNMMSVFNSQKMQQGFLSSPDIVYDIEKAIYEFDVAEKVKREDRPQVDTSINAYMEKKKPNE